MLNRYFECEYPYPCFALDFQEWIRLTFHHLVWCLLYILKILFIKLRQFFSKLVFFFFLNQECFILVNAFPTFTGIFMLFFSFNLLMQWTVFSINQTSSPGLVSTWLLCKFFFLIVGCYLFFNISFSILHIYQYRSFSFLFSYYPFLALVSKLYSSL